MTQEEKAKAYDNLIERLKDLKFAYRFSPLSDTIEEKFPELKESEDERIRKELKALITWAKSYSASGVTMEDAETMMNWLETQGEQKKDARWESLEKLLEADSIYQMAMNDAMVEEAKNKAIKALQELAVSKLLRLEKQDEQPRKVSIWKHWKDGIAGNGEGKLIYLIKNGDDYSLSSCLGFECDYIELSELDKLMQEEKQGEQKCNEEYNITGIKSKNAEGKLGEMIKEKTATEEEILHEPK